MKNICRFLASSGVSRLRSATLICALLLLLTGLFQRTQVHNVNQHYQIIEQLRALERSHLSIKAGVLESRFSLFHNYDAITANSSALNEHISALERAFSHLPAPQPALQAKLAEVAAQATTRELQVEDFKSENAILKNSTTYFPAAMEATFSQLSAQPSSQLNSRENSSELISSLENLSQLILMYCLDNALTDPSEIRQMMAQIASPPLTDNVFRHAQAILRLQEEVNQFVSLLSNESLGDAINELTLAYEDYHRRLTQDKNNYRFLLFIVAVMLVACSSYLAWTKQNNRILKAVNHQLSDAVNEKTKALKEALTQLKRSQANLIQSEKLSSLGQLSAGIAHEINNPISFIHGNIAANASYSQDCLALIELYEQHYPDPAEEIQDFAESIELEFLKQDWQSLLNSMKAGTQRVKKIVDSLRNFSRLDESQYKSVSLHEGLDSSLLLLNHRLAASSTAPAIDVIKQYGDLPLVLCHASAINQVFLNLLSNAIDALRKDSLVSQAPTITLTTHAEFDHVVVKIMDNGAGISKVNQKKIFDPFFTTKPVGQGTGLGLTMSYQTVVDSHHGSMSVSSTPGESTTFQIKLPLKASCLSKQAVSE